MEKQAGFIQDSQSKAIANVQRQQTETSAGTRLTDNRPEAIMQRRLKALANRTAQLESLPIQKQSDLEEEKPVQGKFETLQRVASEDEELLQGKFETVQRVDLEEEKSIQGKFETLQRVASKEEGLLQGKFTQPSSPIQRQEEAPNNTGLPNQLKAGIESLGGMALDHVKVHYNSDKPAQLNAHAYAQGSDIHIAPGQEKHLPHEAWHVVQQAQGRVKPTMQMKMGVPVNDDAGLEHEADVMGAKALQMKSDSIGSIEESKKNTNENKKVQTLQRKNSEGVIQRIMWYMSDDHSGAISKLAKDNPRGFLWTKHTEAKGVFGSSNLKFDEDSSITLWGHTSDGGEDFGGFTPQGLVDSLVIYGLRESKHSEINIISCAPNMTYDKSIPTFAQTVQSLLFKAVGRSIIVKTLPMVDPECESILFRWERLDKIAYVTCPVGKMDGVMTTFNVYNGDHSKTILNWRKKGFTVQEMSFSNILSKLVQTKTVKTHKGKGDMNELLIQDVYGEK